MPVIGTANAPAGYVQFCKSFPAECRSASSAARSVELASSFVLLDSVNREVNETILPRTDPQLYGIAEFWTLPVNAGDCEDYVLLKRKRLIEAGLPQNALLITVVRDQRGDGHAILTVVTDHGDLVLDNQDDRVLPWNATDYRFVKRQARTSPNSWVMVGEPSATSGVATTKPRN